MWLLAAFGFAILISFIFMFCLRCLAGCIVWFSILGIIVFLALAGLIFLNNAGKIGDSKYGYLNIPNSGQSNYEVYGYICFGLSGLALLITLCCCSRIRLAVAVCKAAGQFIVGVCTSMLVPVFQTILALGLWGGCLVVMVYLVSTATFKVANSSDYFSSVSYTDGGLINLYIFIFSTLWSNALIQAIGIFVIASACCMWYYAQGGAGEGLDFPILRSYKMAFRYHFGSLAFGSLILAIVQFLELMVEAFKKQAESTGENKCTKCLINCIQCCLACVERIVEFINKTAYIQIAIRGKSFCYAAKDGFEMVFSNVLRYSIVSGVGSILMFIGKMLIAISTTGCFYLLIMYYPAAKINVLQPIYLLIIVFIMAYAVAMLFMTVYTLAMDTLLACFIVDETNSKGKGGKPQHAPPELAELMETD
jgi:solute carrier family 44 (choline transporter-like protein), member 2/4/5